MHPLAETREIYPLLRAGVLTVVDYTGMPALGDFVVVKDLSFVGRIRTFTVFTANSVLNPPFMNPSSFKPIAHVEVLWTPRNQLGPTAMRIEASLDGLGQLVPRVPTFTSRRAADIWLAKSRQLTAGDWVSWILAGGPPTYRSRWTVEYEGRLIAIDDEAFDWPYWWEHRPKARGRFRVLRLGESGDPHILEVHEIMRP